VPGSTLRCTTPADVYLLLKSSDFVSKDVNQLRELEMMDRLDHDSQNAPTSASDPSTSAIRPILVLKKFFAIPTSHEFRCFVRAGQLICISQRDTGTFFDHLQERDFQIKVRKLLLSFFHTVLSPTGLAGSIPTSPFPIKDYVWDAYISRDMSRVFLMDVNPFLDRTDALLWTWEEVEEVASKQLRGDIDFDEEEDDDDDDDGVDDGEETVMRIFTDGREPILIRPNGQGAAQTLPRPERIPLPRLRTVTSRAQTTQSFPTYARNMMPSDVIDAAQGNIAEFARDWHRELEKATLREDTVVDGEE
jgi:hypothetical protein